MSRHGLHASIAEHLQVNNARGGYKLSLLCTEQGLLLASAGQGLDAELLSAFASLFDEVVRRALRDLELVGVDELTLLDPGRGRFIIRPLRPRGATRLFVVVQADPRGTWRRNTNRLCEALELLLEREGGWVDEEAP